MKPRVVFEVDICMQVEWEIADSSSYYEYVKYTN